MYSDSAQETMQSDGDGVIRGVVRVVALNGERAWVEAESQSACGGCSAAKGCGTKSISRYFGNRTAPLEIVNDFNGLVGDRIEVGIKNSTVIKVSALIYLVPMIGLAGGAALGELLSAGDIVTMGLSLLGLAIGFYISRSLYISNRFAAAVMPVFLRKLEPLAVNNHPAIPLRVKTL